MIAARGLQLDDKRRCRLKQGKHLVKGRDLLVRALQPQLLEFFQRQIFDLPVRACAAPEVGVVEHGQRAVF